MPGALGSRFTMGFWHLEPIVLGLNGTLLITVAIYALINATISVLNGGHDCVSTLPVVSALFTLGACTIMAAIGARTNRRLKSDFISLDVKAWIMSGGITSALLIAFTIGHAVAGTPFAWVSRYVDPVVLALVCLVIIPIPVGTVTRALSDILLIAPADLKAHVDQVASETVTAARISFPPRLHREGRTGDAGGALFYRAEGFSRDKHRGMGPHPRRRWRSGRG